MLKLLSLLCFLTAGFLIWQRYQPLPPSPAIASAKAGPVTLAIPDLGISLPVLTTPLTPKGVTFEPHGNNLVFYGHNWPNILGRLKEVKPGQTINLTYSANLTKTFMIDTVKIVGPNDTSILQATDYELLTIYTCTGFLDTKRLVGVAKLRSN